MIDDIWLRDPVPAFSLGSWDMRKSLWQATSTSFSPATGDRAKSWHTTCPCAKTDGEVRGTYHKTESDFETRCAKTKERT